MKKVILVIVAILAAGAYAYWTLLPHGGQENDASQFVNEKHGYTFEFPSSWRIMGEDDVITFYNTETPPGDGGIPVGIRVDVMALENYDRLSLEDWVDQMERIGPEEETLTKENTTVAGVPAIKKTSIPLPIDEGEPPPISITFAKGNTVFLINYLGREPSYTDEMPGFEALLKSFRFE